MVDKLDLNNILNNLPDIDAEQYELLTKIENDHIFIDLKDEISVNHFEVVENFERYKNGGGLLGESKAHKMLRNVSELVSFYTRNYIIFDEFPKFKNVVATALEGLLISFATDKKYTGRFEHFDEFTIDLWLQYGDAGKISKTLTKYKINNLNIEPKPLEYLIQIGHNFLSMNHTESKFWSNVRESDDFNKMVLNQFFSDKFRERFNNLFLLLSLIKFDKSEQIISVIDKLVTFLQYPNELYWFNIEYLNQFIAKNEHLFTKEHIEKMLSIASDKNQFNEETYELISKIAITNNLNINFSNKFFIDGLLNNERETIRKYDTLISIWKIADFELKTYISRTIEEYLSEHFSFYLFINAVNNEVLHIDMFFDKCIKHLNEMPLGREEQEDIFGNKKANLEFRAFIIFILDNEIDFKDERLTNLKEFGDFEQFGLNPNQFDYSKFKIEWLRYYGFKSFMEKIKNNQSIKTIIEEHLKSNFNERMSRLYFNWFVN